MLFLPAAALCCLCSALVTMAAEQLIQDGLTLTRRVGESVSFSCGGTEQCYSGVPYVQWFQKKENETFKFIFVFHRDSGEAPPDFENSTFTAVNKGKGWELEIKEIKLNHSATYYCFCPKLDTHRWNYLIFGSGTKHLFSFNEQVVKPVVSVYPAASRAHLEGNSSLLCVASAMFPPLVQFSWKRQKKNGGEAEELPPAEGEQLELRESGRSASILLINQQDTNTYKYSCSVKHEGGTVEAQTQQGNEGLVTQRTDISHCSSKHLTPFLFPPTDYVLSMHKVRLLCLLYTVLIVKSLVYCCGLSLLMIRRNKGASTNCTHAD
ncbi:immunoglobulin lambda-1 light chain-like [Pelmatolapia mariae]|uniref:immunoglobulin lambda-1 light chain-like n=1 Tax=Pelmatolapia mariae TaxID=158779 RepID=UPI002FE6B3E6